VRLVGRYAYRSCCKIPLVAWMEKTWEPVLGYSSEVWYLPRGWLGFVFKTPEDTELILGKFWGYEGGSLMLKRWRIHFDPNSEYFSFRHLWVLLPGLPLQLWNSRALAEIGNVLGRFIRVDEESLRSTDKCMARVLVEVDMHVGLLESLEIDWRGHLFVQRLDYLGVPFRCSLCRSTGHLHKDCHSTQGPPNLEEDWEEPSKDHYMDLEEPQDVRDYAALSEEDEGSSPATFIGKLKSLCPSLYFSLTSWERDQLDSSHSSERLPQSSPHLGHPPFLLSIYQPGLWLLWNLSTSL
jgi:hypothetical protein